MGHVQIITTDAGEELVVLSRRDYDALAARAGDDAAEDTMAARLLDETDAALAAGDDVALPDAVWSALETGENPLGVLRTFRGLSVETLASRAGIASLDVEVLEAGGPMPIPVRDALAAALHVPAELLSAP